MVVEMGGTRRRLAAAVGFALLAATAAYAATGPVDVGEGEGAAAVPTTAAPTSEPRAFTLVFTGDVLSHRGVTRQAAANAVRAGGGYDYRPMFAAVRPMISAADLAICHLETPLSRDHSGLAGFPLFNVPFELAGALADAGYDGCSTASNHALDARADGVAATLEQLDRAGVGHAGTARTAQEAGPRLYQVEGVTVGHLSYTFGLNGLTLPADQPWLVNLIDADRILADAHTARAAGAEFVVVSLHWGVEYRWEPTAEQSVLAHQLLPSPDIDLIVGHHAHVVQPVERIGGEYVVYGLGNFLSNQSAGCCTAAAQDGVIVEAQVTEGAPRGTFAVEAMTFTPTRVDRSDFRIVPVALALDDPSLGSELRAELDASWQRTTRVMGALAAPGVTPSIAPGPPP
ncbi:MAG: CapA family protein [Egibacteraceae bacterium]